MRVARIIIILALVAIGLQACGPQKFKTYTGPQVTQLQIYKSQHKLYLLHGNQALKVYNVDLGFQPVGRKEFYGDGKTPEGLYYIDRRNPNSAFYLSLGISYPNPQDVAYAQSLGKDPGGDIFIHGEEDGKKQKTDWTAGCIAVTNKDMRDIYAMVQEGTPIFIFP